MRILFIIPTYNEIENISEIIPEVLNEIAESHILVVDDNSPDGTARKVKQLQEKNPERLFLIIQEKKEGLKKAYVTGFKWAIENKYDYIVEMDADFSHTTHDAKKILELAQNLSIDVTVGSRFMQGGKVVGWPLNRKLLSYMALAYTRLMTGLPVMDPTAGFVCYHYRFLNNIELDQIACSGYAFQVELKFIAWKLGYKIKETPITFLNRKYGESKMNSHIIFEAISSIFMLQWNWLLGKTEKKYKKK